MHVAHALPCQHIFPILIAEGLFERIVVDSILATENSLPQLVQTAVLNEEDWLKRALSFDDALNALVHLILNAISSLRDVADCLCVDSAFSNKPVSFELVDCASLHFLLERKVVPVGTRLHGLDHVVLIKDRFFMVRLGTRMHLKEYAAGLIQPDNEGHSRLA